MDRLSDITLSGEWGQIIDATVIYKSYKSITITIMVALDWIPPIVCNTCGIRKMTYYIDAYMELIGDEDEPIIDPGLAQDLVIQDDVKSLLFDIRQLKNTENMIRSYDHIGREFAEKGTVEEIMYEKKMVLLIQDIVEMYTLKGILENKLVGASMNIPNIRPRGNEQMPYPEPSADNEYLIHASETQLWESPNFYTSIDPSLNESYPFDLFSLALPDDMRAGMVVIPDNPKLILKDRVNTIITVPEFIVNVVFHSYSLDNVDELYRALVNTMRVAGNDDDITGELINAYVNDVIRYKNIQPIQNIPGSEVLYPYEIAMINALTEKYLNVRPFDPTRYRYELKDLVKRRIEKMTHRRIPRQYVVTDISDGGNEIVDIKPKNEVLYGGDAFNAKIKENPRRCCKMNIQSYVAVAKSRAMQQNERIDIRVMPEVELKYEQMDVPVGIGRVDKLTGRGPVTKASQGGRTMKIRIASLPVVQQGQSMPSTKMKRVVRAGYPTSADITPTVPRIDTFKFMINRALKSANESAKALAVSINKELNTMRLRYQKDLATQLITMRMTDELINKRDTIIEHLTRARADVKDELIPVNEKTEIDRRLRDTIAQLTSDSIDRAYLSKIVVGLVRRPDGYKHVVKALEDVGSTFNSLMPIINVQSVPLSELSDGQLRSLAIENGLDLRRLRTREDVIRELKKYDVTEGQKVDSSEINVMVTPNKVSIRAYIDELDTLDVIPIHNIDDEYVEYMRKSPGNIDDLQELMKKRGPVKQIVPTTPMSVSIPFSQ